MELKFKLTGNGVREGQADRPLEIDEIGETELLDYIQSLNGYNPHEALTHLEQLKNGNEVTFDLPSVVLTIKADAL